MSIENIVTDSVSHFGFGLMVSAADYLTPHAFVARKRSEKRSEQKSNELETKKSYFAAMEVLLKANSFAQKDVREKPGMIKGMWYSTFGKKQYARMTQALEDSVPTFAKDSVEYTRAVTLVREYLIGEKLLTADSMSIEQAGKGAWDVTKKIFTEPRLYLVNKKWKFAIASAAEIGLFTWNHYSMSIEQGKVYKQGQGSPQSFTANLWEIPAFWGGLVIGTYLGHKVDNLFMKSAQEKDLDKQLNNIDAQLDRVRDHKVIVDIVNDALKSDAYKQHMGADQDKYTAQPTKKGQKALDKLGKYAKDATSGIGQYFEKKRQAEQAKKDKTASDYEKLLGR